MARLPQPGSDNGTWGEILNEYLSQSLKPDGTIQSNAVTSDALAPNSVTSDALASNAVDAAIIADGSITEALLDTSLQTKLNAAPDVSSVAGKTGAVTLDKNDVGLSDVDNTSDAAKNSAVATLTNKTLTSPRINQILDSNGNTGFGIGGVTSAVNYVAVANGSAGNGVGISARAFRRKV